MSSPAIATVIKMMESLSEDVQERVAEHLREYLEDLQDELKWNKSLNHLRKLNNN
jgi:ubiquitin C-terminal hydrolase